MALYHTAKGPVNYSITGNPTIINGIMTEYAVADYITTSNNLNLGTLPWEIGSKIQINEPISNYYGNYGNSGYFLPMYMREAGPSMLIRANGADEWKIFIINTPIQLGNWYWWKASHDGNGNYTFQVSSDKQNWVADTRTLGILNLPSFIFKMGFVSSGMLTNPIDLNETYITVDGQPWLGNGPVEVKKHQLMGPVGYTKVGSPTIVDGVVTYSTSSNYVKTTTVPLSTASSFEINLSIKTDNESNVFSGLFGNYSTFRIIKVGGSGTFGIQVGSVTTTTEYGANTSYEINIKYDNGQYVISKNGEQINSYQGPVPSTDYPFAIGAVLIANTGNTDGSANYNQIDLNSTYIKVNGKLWFYQPAPSKYIQKDDKLVFASKDLYLKGPENYTAVGNPTITKGVVSGFSTNDYISLDDALPVPNTLEMVVAFKTDFQPSTSNQWLISGLRNLMLGVNTSNKLVYYFGFGTGADWSVSAATGNYTFSGNTDYLIKLTFDGSEYAFYVSSDNGRTWTFDTSYQTSEKLGSKVLSLGINAIKSTPLSGSIDLNKTYIKVNGELWFGKNYASKNIAPVPSGYTYGNTTTPAIGWVDMRTQVFTTAPAGATIGRDE